MLTLSALYDKDNEKYPIYYTGILMFVLMSTIPLNLRISNLPSSAFLLLLVIGLLSLFMLVRNEKVGSGLLNYLKIPQQRQNYHMRIAVMPPGVTKKILEGSLEISQEQSSDPFSLLECSVEHMMLNPEIEMDLAARNRLELMRQRLHSKSHETCTL